MHLFHNFSQNPEGNIGRTEMWMTDEFMKDWLAEVCKQRPEVLLRKWGMLVLDVFKGHPTPETKPQLVIDP